MAVLDEQKPARGRVFAAPTASAHTALASYAESARGLISPYWCRPFFVIDRAGRPSCRVACQHVGTILLQPGKIGPSNDSVACKEPWATTSAILSGTHKPLRMERGASEFRCASRVEACRLHQCARQDGCRLPTHPSERALHVL